MRRESIRINNEWFADRDHADIPADVRFLYLACIAESNRLGLDGIMTRHQIDVLGSTWGIGSSDIILYGLVTVEDKVLHLVGWRNHAKSQAEISKLTAARRRAGRASARARTSQTLPSVDDINALIGGGQ